MLIGSSGQFETHLAPAECGERLRRRLGPLLLRGRADESGFELARWGRTVVEANGAFWPAGSGCTVSYRIGFYRRGLTELAIALVFVIGLTAILVDVGYFRPSVIPLLTIVLLLGVAFNVRGAVRQARWLKGFLLHELEAEPSRA